LERVEKLNNISIAESESGWGFPYRRPLAPPSVQTSTSRGGRGLVGEARMSAMASRKSLAHTNLYYPEQCAITLRQSATIHCKQMQDRARGEMSTFKLRDNHP